MAFTQVSSLDYADIKNALREYLRRNTSFTDYDFEASTLSSILDLLAYNTYYTAFNTTMAVNETFLSSASLRDNVVKVAKQLGYVPKSKTSSRAVVNLKIDFNETALIDPREVPKFVTLKKGNCFITSNPSERSETYQFGLMEDIISPVVNNVAYISNISDEINLRVIEGVYITYKFTVDSTIPNQKFIIPTNNIDTTTITVAVRENQTSTVSTKYTLSDNILNVTSTDKVFFVQEREDRRYELIFGDSVIGRKLEDGEIIEVAYMVSSGENGNNIRTFTFSGELYDDRNRRILNNIVATTVESSNGGDDVEDISQIKVNAPRFYSSQNRAVTLDDYKIITQKIYPNISDIIVYGGENESPPEYGRVKISIKPKYSNLLSSSTKKYILGQLKKFNVASVTPVIVDPSIIEVLLKTEVYYNPSATNLNSEEIKLEVINNLESYKTSNNISKFNGRVKKSKIVSVIDAAENSITSNTTKFLLRKKFFAAVNTKAEYLLCFVNQLDKKCKTTNITSSVFRTSEFPNSDSYFENTEDGIIRIYTIDPITTNKIILFDDVGRVDFAKGEVSISMVNIISGSNNNNEIFITVVPLNDDINAVREVYLDLSVENSTFQIIPDLN